MSTIANTIRMFGVFAVMFGLAVGGYNYPPAVIPFGVYIFASIGYAAYAEKKKNTIDRED